MWILPISELYNSSEDIVVLVLQLFNETASRLIGYLRNVSVTRHIALHKYIVRMRQQVNFF